MLRIFVALLVAVLTLGHAQDYPNRPVTFVVGFGAGGGTDLTGRGLAEAMGQYWGVTTTVINVTGGSGGIAADQVMNAVHDGYTILVSPEIIAVQAVMGFHPTTAYSDWQPYTAAGYNGVISVRRDSRYETFEELLAEVRANPDQITLAASSAGTVWHIQSELARQVGDVQFRFVSYPGSAPSQVAAISGEVEVVLTSIGEQRDLLLSGELRALAAFTAEPVEISGVGVIEPITDYVPELASYMPFSSFIGLAVPQDTPDDIKAAIEDAYLAAVDSDLFRNLIEGQLNGTVLGYDAAESSRFVQENTSVISWLLYDIELAANSPEDFDIPRP